jgi:predicted DNA-binding transcriptional regulator YafY
MNDNSTYSRSSAAQRKQMHYSPNLLSTLNNAIDNHKVAIIEYDSREKGMTERDIEPMAIVYKDRKRHLVAWCRLRNDYRSFRLDRLSSIKLRNEEFTRRGDFKIDEYQDNGSESSLEEVYEEEE